MSVGNAPAIIGLSTFEMDLHAGELRKDGAKTKLQQQPFQILALMLQRPSQVVTREDLRRCNDEARLHYHSREYDAMKQAGLKGIGLNARILVFSICPRVWLRRARALKQVEMFKAG
jgi:hypothetical protein